MRRNFDICFDIVRQLVQMFFVFCFLFTDAIKIQVTEKTNIFAQEESSIEKTLPAKVENLLMKHFDLNQTQKKVFTKICSI